MAFMREDQSMPYDAGIGVPPIPRRVGADGLRSESLTLNMA